MKIQLIRLEEHDDIISARDKLGWGQTGRVVLVWPERAGSTSTDTKSTSGSQRISTTPLTSQLDLVLLKRRALELGVQVAFVSRHPQVRAHARTLGIPVFRTPREAQTLHWRRSRRRRFAWQRRSIEARRIAFRQQIAEFQSHLPLAAHTRLPFLVRAIVFTLGILAILALFTALLPGAHISLTPAIQQQEITFPVSARSDITTINLAGEVPTYPTSTIVEGQATITSTTTTLLPDQFATGSIRFTNLTTETITVPLGTIITTPLPSQIRFATTQMGVISPGPGNSILISIQAVVPGSHANLPAGSIRVLEGSLNYRLTATNTASTRGGTERSAPSPSPEDRIQLYNQLVDILRKNALADLEATMTSGDLLIESTLVLDDQLMKSYEPDGTLPATYLHLTLRMQFSAQKISGADLRQLGMNILNANLPEAYSPLPDTLEININSQPQLDREQVAHWQVTARQKLQARLSKEEAVNLTLGLPYQEAIQRLTSTLPLANSPQITIDPQWWPRIPFIPLRISVSAGGVDE